MKNQLTSSLIISTYNWPAALELTLRSVREQSLFPTEVIIADDGSKDETKELIKAFKKDFPTNLIHVWHEDKGFRKTEIGNRSIAASKAEYIIQIDGDMILHKDFVADHIKHAQVGCFISGSRVLIDENQTKFAQKNKVINFNFLSKGIKNIFNAMYIPFLSKYFYSITDDMDCVISRVRGCNMSFWKTDLLLVNGNNEGMIGWGREDSELSARLINSGLKLKRLKFSAIQFHQFHKINSRSRLNVNDDILQEAISEKKEKCIYGVSKYL